LPLWYPACFGVDLHQVSFSNKLSPRHQTGCWEMNIFKHSKSLLLKVVFGKSRTGPLLLHFAFLYGLACSRYRGQRPNHILGIKNASFGLCLQNSYFLLPPAKFKTCTRYRDSYNGALPPWVVFFFSRFCACKDFHPQSSGNFYKEF